MWQSLHHELISPVVSAQRHTTTWALTLSMENGYQNISGRVPMTCCTPSYVTAIYFSEVPAKHHTSSARAKSFMLIGRQAEWSGSSRPPMVRSTTLVLGKRFIPKTDLSKFLAKRIRLLSPHRLHHSHILDLVSFSYKKHSPTGPAISHLT